VKIAKYTRFQLLTTMLHIPQMLCEEPNNQRPKDNKNKKIFKKKKRERKRTENTNALST